LVVAQVQRPAVVAWLLVGLVMRLVVVAAAAGR
jgi:hypothetical protein